MTKSGKPADRAEARAGDKPAIRVTTPRRHAETSESKRMSKSAGPPEKLDRERLRAFLAKSPPTAPRRDAERPTFLSDAKAAFERAADADGLDTQQRMAALRELLQVYEARATSTLPLPSKAPQLWVERDPALKENPAAFTRRVYGPWIGTGFTRPQLRALDDALYHALSVWEHRHPEDAVKDLPTLAEVIDSKIARLADEFSPDELRKLGATLQTRLRRARN